MDSNRGGGLPGGSAAGVLRLHSQGEVCHASLQLQPRLETSTDVANLWGLNSLPAHTLSLL
uniref:Uncharacterized protein n=1 Tax=Hyaloperonospora arabidopsidis (strain Emoy2) TaxID=559515 RepID=M4C238_HYAAE